MEGIVGNMINVWCAPYVENVLVTDPFVSHLEDQTELREHFVVVAQGTQVVQNVELVEIVQVKMVH